MFKCSTSISSNEAESQVDMPMESTSNAERQFLETERDRVADTHNSLSRRPGRTKSMMWNLWRVCLPFERPLEVDLQRHVWIIEFLHQCVLGRWTNRPNRTRTRGHQECRHIFTLELIQLGQCCGLRRTRESERGNNKIKGTLSSLA